MSDATPESQVPVVVRALKSYGFNATPGKKHFANKITIRGANESDRAHIFAISREFAKGFVVEILRNQTYFLVTLHTRPANVAIHTDVPPIHHGKGPYDG
jgi:hypothetical protein